MRIERELRLHDAGRRDVVIRRGELQQFVGQFAPQVEHDAMAGIRHSIFGNERADAAKEKDADHGNGQPLRAHRIVGLERLHDRDHEHGHDEVAGRDDDHADHRERKSPPVRADVAQ